MYWYEKKPFIGSKISIICSSVFYASINDKRMKITTTTYSNTHTHNLSSVTRTEEIHI